jgi:hypothetical protein
MQSHKHGSDYKTFKGGREEMMKRGAFVLFLSLLFAFGAVEMSFAVVEWSDIQYIEGNYSRIYFDYVSGTFHCINDWIVNQDDGGTKGGLNPGEYNRFNFRLNSVSYEIRIYADGTGTVSPSSLTNFKNAVTWATSPNEPTKKHTIWEFSFDVPPTTISTFVPHDPVGPAVTIYTSPPTPSIVTAGPSANAHVVDGEFTTWPGSPSPVPDPTRSYQSPVGDPWFPSFDIELLSGGGFILRPRRPEPAITTYGLIALGLAGMITLGIALRRYVRSRS